MERIPLKMIQKLKLTLIAEEGSETDKDRNMRL